MRSASCSNFNFFEGGSRICHERKVMENYEHHIHKLNQITSSKSKLNMQLDRSNTSMWGGFISHRGFNNSPKEKKV